MVSYELSRHLWVVPPILKKRRIELAKDVRRLAPLGIQFVDFTEGGIVMTNGAES